MNTLTFTLTNATNLQEIALQELCPILNIALDSNGIPVRLEQSAENALSICWKEDSVTIIYREQAQLFRAWGLLVEQCNDGIRNDIKETPWHTTLAPMLDCSRNHVHPVPVVKQLVRHLALMGYNALMLYTEDTYEIPDEPYFGYMRGRYTAAEIKEIDSYCQLFGIELIPCIQVLAHLNALLHWNAYKPMFDAADILQVGEDKTYALVEKMFQAVTSMFSSKRINLGMDEAFLLGRGNYLDKNGYEDRNTIMYKHLDRIMALCDKYQLNPMMWSDMFFATAPDGSPRHYYETKIGLPEDVYETAPEGMALVFWDYYHKEVSNIDAILDLHNNFKNQIVFAGGAWRWKGFAPSNDVSLIYSRAALESCRKHNVTELLVTAWAESGEAGLYTVLPVFQLFAEDCYCRNTENAHLAKRLQTCANANFDDFMALDLLNRSDKNPIAEDKNAGLTNPPNPCRYVLWQDVLCGLYDKHIEGNVTPEDFSRLVPLYEAAAQRNPQWAYLFNMAAALSRVLALKCDVGVRLRRAYKGGDKTAMENIANEELPQIASALKTLRAEFYTQWMTECKPFGYEVVDMRFGGLQARLDTAMLRIRQYLNGQLTNIPELEETILWADCRPEDSAPTDAHVHHWWQCTTVSVLNT